MGLFDASDWMKQVYGQGWYLGSDGQKVYVDKVTGRWARVHL